MGSSKHLAGTLGEGWRRLIEQSEEHETDVVILWLLWHYGWLQGVFWKAGLFLQQFIVIHGSEFSFNGLESIMSMWSDDPCRISLGAHSQEFQKKVNEQNDGIVFLRCNIDSREEERAKKNVQFLKEKFCPSHADLNEEVRVLPILEMREGIPAIGVYEEEMLVLEFSSDLFQQRISFGKEEQNKEYLENLKEIVIENFREIINNIRWQKEKNKKLGTEGNLLTIASVVAMLWTGQAFTQAYEKIMAQYADAIHKYFLESEKRLNFTDFTEILCIKLRQKLERREIKSLRRSQVESEDEVTVGCAYYDEQVVYFFEKDLQSVCTGELENVPLRRILNGFEQNGMLELGNVPSRNFGKVVVLYSNKSKFCKRVRLVGIRRKFLEWEGEKDG